MELRLLYFYFYCIFMLCSC